MPIAEVGTLPAGPRSISRDVPPRWQNDRVASPPAERSAGGTDPLRDEAPPRTKFGIQRSIVRFKCCQQRPVPATVVHFPEVDQLVEQRVPDKSLRQEQ